MGYVAKVGKQDLYRIDRDHMEVYIDETLVKSARAKDYVAHLVQIFLILDNPT